MNVGEEQLVARAQRGDVAAFEELITAYQKKVFNLAYRMVGNQEDASDLAQEAFLKAFRAMPDFKGQASFSTWLYRIVSNVCLDELRQRRRRQTISLDEPLQLEDEPLPRQVADSGDGPEEILERREVQEIVQQGIGELGDDHRLALILRELQGKSYQEIAEITGCNIGTVKSRINRARLSLKQLLVERELLNNCYVEINKPAAEGGTR
ncbi:MAG: sigma-70 family RNA polymerase sigma factor [Bacillota bacterium]